MIDRWMFDSLTAEVSYRAEQLQRGQWISFRAWRRRRRDRAAESRPATVPVAPTDAAHSRTQEKVSAG
jgi:hypothetical protein